MLWALALSAIGAQSAFAIPTGTTAFTCSSAAPTKTFKTEHCVPGETGTAFGHVAFTGQTEVQVTNSKTSAETTAATTLKIEDTIAGIKTPITATGVEATGTVENKLSESGEHLAHYKFSTIRLTGVTVDVANCGVVGIPGGAGVIETKPMTATTEGQEDFLKFLPQEEFLIAEYEIVQLAPTCPIVGKYKLMGSFKGVPNGATVRFGHNEITGQGTLRTNNVAGPKVGIEGLITISGRTGGSGSYTPIAHTTVPTP